ncbi:neurofilament heavy polypeptide-like [Diachasmimorpha longicaudata]|uniref:neurofilament heavy polypeptide-like n=1 Tax=Diachasmimorpha longicaudata TaxID=58733 RepID=UPI0030B8B4BB
MEDHELAKKSSKQPVYEDNDQVVKEQKKKKKKKSKLEATLSATDLDDDLNDSAPKLPDWLEMTDSEDQFQKPKESMKKKKRKIESEASEVHSECFNDVNLTKSGLEDDEGKIQIESKDSSKKKKKNKREVEEPGGEATEKNRPSPKKFKKEKTEEAHIVFQENGHVIGAEGSSSAEGTPVKETHKNVQKSSDKSPQKSSKSHKNALIGYLELAPNTEEPKAPVKQRSPKKSPIKSVESLLKPSFTKQTLDQKSRDPSSVQTPVTPKKQVRKITKVPLADQVTLGEEYKMKKVDEKSCKKCNETVKIKKKIMLRDMGTQTSDSALMNGIKTRGRPKATPKAKTEDPVSVKDRIIVPKQPNDETEVYDLKNKRRALTVEQIDRLREMVVTLKHPVPPQHDVEITAGCRALTSEEKKHFQKFEKLRTGVWHIEEDKTILKNWRNFCKRHDWNPELTHPFTAWRHKGAYYIPRMEDRKKFLQFLAHGLSSRSLYHVYTRFKNLFSTHKTDRYTPLEDNILLEKIDNNSGLDKNMYLAELATTLNRTRQSIWRRYKILKQKSEDDY